MPINELEVFLIAYPSMHASIKITPSRNQNIRFNYNYISKCFQKVKIIKILFLSFPDFEMCGTNQHKGAYDYFIGHLYRKTNNTYCAVFQVQFEMIIKRRVCMSSLPFPSLISRLFLAFIIQFKNNHDVFSSLK